MPLSALRHGLESGAVAGQHAGAPAGRGTAEPRTQGCSAGQRSEHPSLVLLGSDEVDRTPVVHLPPHLEPGARGSGSSQRDEARSPRSVAGVHTHTRQEHASPGLPREAGSPHVRCPTLDGQPAIQTSLCRQG